MPRTLSRAPTHSSEFFTWDKRRRMMVVEDSTLRGNCVGAPCGVLNSKEIGFKILDAHTGKTTSWYLAETKKEDGEVVVWVFKATIDTIADNPHLATISVHVLND